MKIPPIKIKKRRSGSSTATINPFGRPLDSASPLQVADGKHYKGGFDDAVLASLAARCGEASIQNPDVWGPNGQPPGLVGQVNATHDTTSSLVGFNFRQAVQLVDDGLEQLKQQIATKVEVVLGRTDDYAHKAVTSAKLQRDAEEQGVGIPHRLAHVWLALCILGLVWGDLPIISKSYEQWHLSSSPLVPGLHLTDELHLAALASVCALVILSHIAGYKFRLLAHAFNRRRLVPPSRKDERDELPRPSAFAATVAVACLVAALILLDGLSALRADYLASQRETGNQSAFFAVNIGILAAAVGAGFLFANPFGRTLADALRFLRQAEHLLDTGTAELVSLVGTYNGGIDQRVALLAQAGHHVGASEADAGRQIHLILDEIILAQPEPTTERLFPESLPQPTHREGDELHRFIIGVTDLPIFEHLNVADVIERRALVRELVNSIRLPEFNTAIEAETDGDADKDLDGPETTPSVITLHDAANPAGKAAGQTGAP